MTVTEFKEKYPHLSHLEGNELWDAMAMAVWKEQPPIEKLPNDDEIAFERKIGEYTFTFTKGAKRSFEKLMEGYKPPTFSNFGLLTPNRRINDEGQSPLPKTD